MLFFVPEMVADAMQLERALRDLDCKVALGGGLGMHPRWRDCAPTHKCLGVSL